MILFLLFWIGLLFANDFQTQELTVGVNMIRSLSAPGIARASVGNSKVAKVRVASQNEVLITGIKPGRTTAFIWSSNGREKIVEILVVANDQALPFRSLATDPGVVKVAVEFLELDVNLSEGLGLKWPEAIQFSGSGSYQGGTSVTGLNYALTFASAKGWIEHLVHKGWARVIANPELYVRLGEEAKFHSGGEIPIPSTSESYGRFHKHIEWKTHGLSVRVRPQSRDRLHIESAINVDISEIHSSFGVDGIPAILKRNLETKMNSVDGETVVLSGLTRHSESEQKESVPFLGAIPIIGLLFSKSNTSRQEGNIYLSITFSFVTRTLITNTVDRFKKRITKPQGL